MSAHTPGPWQRFTAAGGQPAIKQAGPKGKYLFDVSEYAGLGDEAEANARLIAAAPDMLTVLKIAAYALEGTHPDTGDYEVINSALKQARAAIAKAEGTA